MPELSTALFELIDFLRPMFSQERIFERVQRLMITGMLTMGNHFITRMIATAGLDQRDWTSDYRVFSISPWKDEDLFQPIIQQSLEYVPGNYVSVAMDDVGVERTGKHIPGAQYMRDPLSPAFHVNFVWGLRFIQFSLLLPLHQTHAAPCRGIPIRFAHVPIVKKPGKRASEETQKAYREEKKRRNLSQAGVAHMKAMRKAFDEAGARDRWLLVFADGSYCNQTTFRADYDRTSLIARARKDAALCYPVDPQDRKHRNHFYGKRFTPEAIRQDSNYAYKTTQVYFAGKYRALKYKEVKEVYWPRGAKRKPIRLIVVAATPYHPPGKNRPYYREPAYLLTTDQDLPIDILMQGYFDRWQIEVNHRDEKSVMGVGQAQVWNAKSVKRQPAFVVASYSLLLLAGLKAFGPERGEAYEVLPSWRKKAKRPSCLDLIQRLRREGIEFPEIYAERHIYIKKELMIRKASA